MSSLIDNIRVVPEAAVRLYCGAEVVTEERGITLRFEGHELTVAPGVYFKACEIVRIIQIRSPMLRSVTDVLNLRHECEDLFIEDLFGAKGLPRILFVPAGESASAWLRARLPCDILMDRGLAIAHFTDRLDISKAIRYDILWVQLGTSPVLLKIVEEAKSQGVKIVYDFDDAFWCIPPENPAAELYVRDRKEEVWKMIELSDVVTVSTEALACAPEVRERANDLRCLPNKIMAAIWPIGQRPDSRTCRILWAGSMTHARDLAIVAPALCAVLRKYEGKVRFTCLGEKLPEALEPVRDYVDLLQFVAFEDYAGAISNVAADFAIAPLADDEFNTYKSAIKFLEYSACGYYTLMSPVGEYKEIEFDGRCLVNDGSWESALSWAVENRIVCHDLGKKARERVLKTRCLIKDQAANWISVAQDLVREKVSQGATDAARV